MRHRFSVSGVCVCCESWCRWPDTALHSQITWLLTTKYTALTATFFNGKKTVEAFPSTNN